MPADGVLADTASADPVSAPVNKVNAYYGRATAWINPYSQVSVLAKMRVSNVLRLKLRINGIIAK
jgi:hypothetical protein